MTKSKTTIGIIGLTRFGTLLASILSKTFSVSVYNYIVNEEVKNKAGKTGANLVDFKTAVNSDIVILAVPIANTEENIKRVAQHIKKGALVMDVCSVKTLPCRWLKENIDKDVEIMGTHPMFGPNSTGFDLEKQSWTLERLQIVLCPLRINKVCLKKIKKYLESLKLEVIETTPDEHDFETAMTVGLVHFLGRSLWEAGVREQPIFTPGFQKVISIFKHTVNDSWGLFYDMHNFNPYAKEVRENFIRACQKMNQKIIDHGTAIRNKNKL